MHHVCAAVLTFRRQVDARMVPLAYELGRQHALAITWTDIYASATDTAHNEAVRRALRSEARWLLVLGDDCYFDAPRDGARELADMLATADRERWQVIAPPYRIGADGAPNVWRQARERATWEEIRGRVLPVAAVGSAGMAIDLAWLRERWDASCGPWFQTIQAQAGAVVGADVRFCLAVGQLGGRVACYGRTLGRHREGLY